MRDKDGVSAALLVAELAATLKAEGRTLVDVLDDLAVEHGVHATDAVLGAGRRPGRRSPPVMDRLRAAPPATLGGVDVAQVDDLARGDGGLPPTEGLRYYLADGSRVIVRPSGTEPKLKVYLEVIEPVGHVDRLAAARRTAAERLAALRDAMETLTRL